MHVDSIDYTLIRFWRNGSTRMSHSRSHMPMVVLECCIHARTCLRRLGRHRMQWRARASHVTVLSPGHLHMHAWARALGPTYKHWLTLAHMPTDRDRDANGYRHKHAHRHRRRRGHGHGHRSLTRTHTHTHTRTRTHSHRIRAGPCHNVTALRTTVVS